MKTPWRIADILDLEYLLARDEDADPVALARRDRGLYLEQIRPQKGDGRSDPGLLLYHWLRQRRRMLAGEDGEPILPGRLWQEIHGLLRVLGILAGLVSGGVLASSFLAYSGDRPVNVALYLWIFVASQQFLLLLLAILAVYRSLSGRGLRASILCGLLVRLASGLLLRLKAGLLRQMDAGERLRLLAVLGRGRGRLRSHGTLLVWPMFILVQLFAVSFNGGVLAATLVKVVTADVAFGWQSTLQVSAVAVARLVRLIALPWSWFLPPGIASPSLARIEGSRMVLKDGIYHLATVDLASWWPFLCLAVFFYGLVPRLVLLLVGHLGLRRALARLSLDSPACSRLLHRMLTPGLRTGGSVPGPGPAGDAAGEEGGCTRRPSAGQEPRPHVRAASPGALATEPVALLALVPDELYDHCPLAILAEQVLARTGAGLAGVVRTGEEDEGEDETLARIRDLFGQGKAGGILVLQEAWQPPIQEFFDFLLQLRGLVGKDGRLVVALVGRPGPDTIFTPVSELNSRIWSQGLATLADPGLEIIEMVAP